MNSGGCVDIFVKHGCGVVNNLLRTTINSYEIRAGQMDATDVFQSPINSFFTDLNNIFNQKSVITTIIISDMDCAPYSVKMFINNLINTRKFSGKTLPDGVIFIKVNYI